MFPQLQLVRFDCLRCGFTTAPIAQRVHSGMGKGLRGGADLVKPAMCPDCNGAGPFRLSESKTVYRNYQKVGFSVLTAEFS